MISDTLLTLTLLVDATVRGAAPLVLAALGGPLAERSGIVDIGLAVKMLTSAFAAAAAAAVTGSAWAGASPSRALHATITRHARSAPESNRNPR